VHSHPAPLRPDINARQVVNIVRDHRHQCAVVCSCTRIINADAAKAQRLLYQRRRKAVKISTKVSCEVCARPLSAPAATAAGAAVAGGAAAAAPAVLTFGCGHIFHGTGQAARMSASHHVASLRLQPRVCMLLLLPCRMRLGAAACGAWCADTKQKRRRARRIDGCRCRPIKVRASQREQARAGLGLHRFA